MKYAVIYEKSAEGWGAYVPDLPGVSVVGETLEEVKALIREAIELHIEALKQEGQPLPAANTAIMEYVEIAAG